MESNSMTVKVMSDQHTSSYLWPEAVKSVLIFCRYVLVHSLNLNYADSTYKSMSACPKWQAALNHAYIKKGSTDNSSTPAPTSKWQLDDNLKCDEQAPRKRVRPQDIQSAQYSTSATTSPDLSETNANTSENPLPTASSTRVLIDVDELSQEEGDQP
jgi:hypothetical protein